MVPPAKDTPQEMARLAKLHLQNAMPVHSHAQMRSQRHPVA